MGESARVLEWIRGEVFGRGHRWWTWTNFLEPRKLKAEVSLIEKLQLDPGRPPECFDLRDTDRI